VGHPLARPSGGTHASLDSLELADAQAFVERHYQPRNMVVLVSGDFENAQIADLLALLPEKLRGDHSHPTAPLHLTEAARIVSSTGQRVTKISAHVPGPEVWVGWPLPPAGKNAAGNTVLLMLARSIRPAIMGERSAGMIGLEQIGYGEVSVSMTQGRLGSWLLCRSQLPPGSDPERAAEEIIGHYSEFWLELDWDREWFERGRAAAATQFALESGRLDERLSLATFGALFDPAVRFKDMVKSAAMVSFPEIAGLARNYVIRGKARVVIVSPSAAPTRFLATRPGFEMLRADDVDTAAALPENKNVADIVHVVGAGKALVKRLSNGLEIVILPRAHLPVSTIALGFHASPAAGEVSVRDAVANAVRYDDHYRATDLGIARSRAWRPDLLLHRFHVLADDEGNALNLLGRTLRHLDIEWPSASFSDRMSMRETLEGTVESQALRGFYRGLWGTHPYGARARAFEVDQVPGYQVENWVNRMMHPANGVLIVVGDVDTTEILRRAEEELGSWRHERGTISEITRPPKLRTDEPLRIISVKNAGARSAKLQLGCLLPAVTDLGQALVGELLSALVRKQLFERLRQEMGATYTPEADAHFYRGGSAALIATADVSATDLPFALSTIKAMMDLGSSPPFNSQDLERARFILARQSSFRYGTSEALADTILTYWNMGWPPATLDEYPTRLAAVSFADVERALATCRANAVLAVLADSR
jgi:predicted Zn-dependent peptidase